MNFAWIANVFGFIGSKKEQFSFKRITKSLNSTDIVKKNGYTQVFQFKKLDARDFVATVSYPSQKVLIPVQYLNIDLNNDSYLLSGIKKQMLFPHHGFW
ncbi:MAG: hypothetical protein ABIP28_11340 [Mucilaginibacter sp.]